MMPSRRGNKIKLENVRWKGEGGRGSPEYCGLLQVQLINLIDPLWYDEDEVNGDGIWI